MTQDKLNLIISMNGRCYLRNCKECEIQIRIGETPGRVSPCSTKDALKFAKEIKDEQLKMSWLEKLE